MLLVESLYVAAMEPLMFAFPETAGLLAIGLGLLSTAALLRRVFREPAKCEADEDIEDTI